MHWGAVTTGAPPLEAVAGVTILLSLPLLSSLPIEKCFLSGFSRPWALIGLTTAEGGGQLVMVKDQTVVTLEAIMCNLRQGKLACSYF